MVKHWIPTAKMQQPGIEKVIPSRYSPGEISFNNYLRNQISIGLGGGGETNTNPFILTVSISSITIFCWQRYATLAGNSSLFQLLWLIPEYLFRQA